MEIKNIPAENKAFSLLKRGAVIEFEHRGTRTPVVAKVHAFQNKAELTSDSKQVVLIKLKPLNRALSLPQEYIYNYDTFTLVESYEDSDARNADSGAVQSDATTAGEANSDLPPNGARTEEDRRDRMRTFQLGRKAAKELERDDEITSDAFPGTLQIDSVELIQPIEMDQSGGIFHDTEVCLLGVKSRNPAVIIPAGTRIRSDQLNLGFVAQHKGQSAASALVNTAPVAPAAATAMNTYEPESHDEDWKDAYEKITDQVEKFEKLNWKLHALFRVQAGTETVIIPQSDVTDEWGRYLIEELRNFQSNAPDQNTQDIADKHCNDMGIYFYSRMNETSTGGAKAAATTSTSSSEQEGKAGAAEETAQTSERSSRSSSRHAFSFGVSMGGTGISIVMSTKFSHIHYGGLKAMPNPWEYGGQSPSKYGLQTKNGGWLPPKDTKTLVEKLGQSYIIPSTRAKINVNREHCDPADDGYKQSEDKRCYISVPVISEDWDMTRFEVDVGESYVAHACLINAVWRGVAGGCKWISIDQLYELTDNRLFYCALMFKCTRNAFDGHIMMLGTVIDVVEASSPLFNIAIFDSASVRDERPMSAVESAFFDKYDSPEAAISMIKESGIPMVKEWLRKPVFNSTLCRWLGAGGGHSIMWSCFKKATKRPAPQLTGEDDPVSTSSMPSTEVTIIEPSRSNRRRDRRRSHYDNGGSESERNPNLPFAGMPEAALAAMAMIGQGKIALQASEPTHQNTRQLQERLTAVELQNMEFKAEAVKEKALRQQQAEFSSTMLAMSNQMTAKAIGGIMMGCALQSGNMQAANSYAMEVSSSSAAAPRAQQAAFQIATAPSSPSTTHGSTSMMLTDGPAAAEILSPASQKLHEANELEKEASRKRKHYEKSNDPRFLQTAEQLEKKAKTLRDQAFSL